MNGITDMASVLSIDETGIGGIIFQRLVLDGGSDHIFIIAIWVRFNNSLLFVLLEQSTDGGILLALLAAFQQLHIALVDNAMAPLIHGLELERSPSAHRPKKKKAVVNVQRSTRKPPPSKDPMSNAAIHQKAPAFEGSDEQCRHPIQGVSIHKRIKLIVAVTGDII
jgi:hypothetical protein